MGKPRDKSTTDLELELANAKADIRHLGELLDKAEQFKADVVLLAKLDRRSVPPDDNWELTALQMKLRFLAFDVEREQTRAERWYQKWRDLMRDRSGW